MSYFNLNHKLNWLWKRLQTSGIRQPNRDNC